MTRWKVVLMVGVAACLLLAIAGVLAVAGETEAPPDALVEEQIDRFVQYRNSLLVSNSAPGSRPVGLGQPAQARLDLAEEQLPQLAALMRELGEEYGSFESEISVLETMPIDLSTFEVLYGEFTTFFDGPGAEQLPEAPAYGADYVAVFVLDEANSWRLESVDLAGGGVGIPPMTEPIEGRKISSSVEELMESLQEYDDALEGATWGPDGPPDLLSPPP